MTDFTVKNWKPWEDHETNQPILDIYGNIKGSLTLSGVGEPVDGTFKHPPAVGSTISGSVEEYTTKSGSTRQRFKREPKQEPAFSRGGTYQPRDDAAIRAQWSLSQSIQIGMARGDIDNKEMILNRAKWLFNAVNEIKGGSV